MVEQETKKWKGEIIEEIKNVTPQQLWPLIEDFSSLNKVFSKVEKCYHVEGVAGEVGAIRCCESAVFSGAQIQYAKEKLVMIDKSNMCLTYQVIDNNVGFNYYVATMQLLPINDGEDRKCGCGCKFVWTIVADPVQGFTQESFFGLLKSNAQNMAKDMEEALYFSNIVK